MNEVKDQKSKNSSDDILLAFYKELEKVRDNQRSLVIISHGFIELILNTIIDIKLKHGKNKITKNTRDYPQSVKLVIINELKIIDNDLFKILDGFLHYKSPNVYFYYL